MRTSSDRFAGRVASLVRSLSLLDRFVVREGFARLGQLNGGSM